MSNLPTVAIAGATGNVGAKVAAEFLKPEFRARFKQVVILSRSSTSETARRLGDLGATVRVYEEEALAAVLSDVDILINTIGPTGHAFKEKLLRCLPQTAVKLYFPSEFGVNHYLHDFSHDEWNAKKHHFRLAKELLVPKNIKICRVYAGLFLEDSIGPWFGFFTKEGRYEAVGSYEQPCSYTSMSDLGKCLAILAALPLSDIPEEIQLSGDSKSFAQIAQIMGSKGGGEIEVSSIPLASYKQQVLANPSPTPERYLRFLMAEGKIDHTETGLGNHNFLVEGDAAFGSWSSLMDLADETNGRPWIDADWKP